MSQIPYNHFGNIINSLPMGIAKVDGKEVSVSWDENKRIKSLF